MPGLSKDKYKTHAHIEPINLIADDIENVPGAQTNKLSKLKARLNMHDGDEHFVNNLLVGPINDMYLAIRAFSLFPHVTNIHEGLVRDTQTGRR